MADLQRTLHTCSDERLREGGKERRRNAVFGDASLISPW